MHRNLFCYFCVYFYSTYLLLISFCFAEDLSFIFGGGEVMPQY